MIIFLISYAADPLGGAWWDAAKTSFVILVLVTVVVASVTGVVTWPPEKKRMDKQHEKDEQAIKELTEALKESIAANQRATPTMGRVAEIVETRVRPAPETEQRIDQIQRDLERVASSLKKVVGDE